jgi:hypothetical protein
MAVAGRFRPTCQRLQIYTLRRSLDAALNTSKGLQVYLVECEGNRLKLQASLRSCDTEVESLKTDIEDTYEAKLVASRRCRSQASNNTLVAAHGAGIAMQALTEALRSGYRRTRCKSGENIFGRKTT